MYSNISANYWPICTKFGMQIDIGHARVTLAENPTFPKTQDGGRPPSWKYNYWPICSKFGTQIDFGHAKVTIAQNSTLHKIQDGGRPPSWKYKNSFFLAIYWHICTKFGMMLDIGHARITVAPNAIFLKSNMADGRHLVTSVINCLTCSDSSDCIFAMSSQVKVTVQKKYSICLLYTSPSPRD